MRYQRTIDQSRHPHHLPTLCESYLTKGEESKELMRDRDRLLQRARCTGLPVDWELYHDSRQVVKIRLRKAEQEHINKEMEGRQNTTSQWKLIRNCLPRKEATQQVYTREVKAVAEEFNEFFVSVGAKASEA